MVTSEKNPNQTETKKKSNLGVRKKHFQGIRTVFFSKPTQQIERESYKSNQSKRRTFQSSEEADREKGWGLM